jgi:hypothetical protein
LWFQKGKKQGQKEMLNLVTNKSLFAIIIHIDMVSSPSTHTNL